MTAGWQEIGDGCFRRRYRAFDLNIGVVRGSDGLLVLDTRADLRQAEELLDHLAELGQPVRWVVNSHWHFDHLFGNQRFREAAADPAGRPTRRSRPTSSCGVTRRSRRCCAVGVRRVPGRPRAAYGEAAGDEYDRVVLTPPDHLVAERHVLDLGDRGVELVHLGRGHTDNDLVVSVPGAGVVYAGDLLEESAPPAYGDDCFPLDWPATAGALVARAPTTFVPGHGDVMGLAAAAEQATAIAAVADVIRALHDVGVPPADTLAEGGDRWPFPPAALREAVARAYATLG